MKSFLNAKSLGFILSLTVAVLLFSAKAVMASDGDIEGRRFWSSGQYTECIGGIGVTHCTYHVFWIKTKDKVCGNGSC